MLLTDKDFEEPRVIGMDFNKEGKMIAIKGICKAKHFRRNK